MFDEFSFIIQKLYEIVTVKQVMMLNDKHGFLTSNTIN